MGKITEDAASHLMIDVTCVCVTGEGCPCKDRKEVKKSILIPKSRVTGRSSDGVEVTLPGRFVKATEVQDATPAVGKQNISEDSDKFAPPSGGGGKQQALAKSALGDLFDVYQQIGAAIGSGAGYVYCRIEGKACGGATVKPPKKN